MTVCPCCHQSIRYIISKDSILTVNPVAKTIITERGRRVVGYEVHSCKKDLTDSGEAIKE